MHPSGTPPRLILQIYRERLKPGSEAAYGALEADTAKLAASLGCPHPYLGAEALTGPKEVWWFNGYASPADRDRVHDAYATNAPLMAALRQNSERKASLTAGAREVFATCRPDLGSADVWTPGRGRFLVVASTASGSRAESVFETEEGARFVITPAPTLHDAEQARSAGADADAVILAVRPAWSLPAEDWIAADPAFWRPDPPPQEE